MPAHKTLCLLLAIGLWLGANWTCARWIIALTRWLHQSGTTANLVPATAPYHVAVAASPYVLKPLVLLELPKTRGPPPLINAFLLLVNKQLAVFLNVNAGGDKGK